LTRALTWFVVVQGPVTFVSQFCSGCCNSYRAAHHAPDTQVTATTCFGPHPREFVGRESRRRRVRGLPAGQHRRVHTKEQPTMREAKVCLAKCMCQLNSVRDGCTHTAFGRQHERLNTGPATRGRCRADWSVRQAAAGHCHPRRRPFLRDGDRAGRLGHPGERDAGLQPGAANDCVPQSPPFQVMRLAPPKCERAPGQLGPEQGLQALVAPAMTHTICSRQGWGRHPLW
jgi:hypothetical protein